MRKIILSFCLLCSIQILTFSANRPHYTVIVSLDGFRWDYTKMYDTPFLKQIELKGVSAVMRPSFPASTFPNHYTLATGLRPDHHGIVNNVFWDTGHHITFSMSDEYTRSNPYYYLGEPIWVTAQKQGVKTANVYWVGSDIAVSGHLPTYHKVWAEKPQLTFEQRIEAVIEALSLPEVMRPRLVMAYFDEPDHTGHVYGPHAPETSSMVHRMDSLMHVLYDKIQKLPHGAQINLIITSDHGMTEISPQRFVAHDHYLKKSWVRHIAGTSPTSIFTREGYQDSVIQALKGVEHLSVWRKTEVPKELHYGSSNRLGDVIVAPDLGWQFAPAPRKLNGAHGYSPYCEEMQVVFRAIGPDFKQAHKAPIFDNVDVYSLLCHLLQITPAATDGSLDGVANMLKETNQTKTPVRSKRIKR